MSKEEEITALKSSLASLEAQLGQMEEDKRAMTSAPIAIQSDLRAAVPATPIAQRTPLNTKESLSETTAVSGKGRAFAYYHTKDPSSPRVTMSAQDAAILNNKELDALLSASGESRRSISVPPAGGYDTSYRRCE